MSGPTLRSDALRTRERLLEAAGDLLEMRGPAFTLPELARHAGVGTATVYRHFTDVADLFSAFESRAIAALVAAIDEAGTAGGARQSFDRICAIWIRRSVRESAAARFLRSHRGLLERYRSGDPGIVALIGRLVATLEALIAAGLLPEQDPVAAALVWMTLFDERTTVDLSRIHAWTTRRITDYLSAAVLGALRATA
ncbi:TetR family transcriptional regulator [Nakamurella sp. YIM 132087]|uniref:TetR family transcriptional regulator n=1 Tax=Nakamurella alba TaxID=2665158 RepID=A0A7K1FUB2_9ACTN|nr:TetR/AcrR family transcriptional regulator [Nakamurella alba]MTD16424.1 TetR family transcriptional regulator [Nakamurella alba]